MMSIFIVLLILQNCQSFYPNIGSVLSSSRLSLSSSSAQTAPTNNNLIDKLQSLILQHDESHDSDEKLKTREDLKQVISSLENEYADSKVENDDISRFDPLIGYYNVSYVQSAKENDNPVGGKWTRNNNRIKRQLVNTRRTLQHILPVNTTGFMRSRYQSSVVAEAVNVISLDVFWTLIRLTVILRGDAIYLSQGERYEIQKLGQDEKSSKSLRPTLSNLAVKAYFDPPRIIIGKTGKLLNFQIGPPTSVVLDTSYIDDKIRIGVGGTSGTRFVFTKCSENDHAPKEFFGLLRKKPVNRATLLVYLCFVCGFGVRSIFKGSVWFGGAVTAIGLLATTAVSLSTGGVEDDNKGDEKEQRKP